MTKTTNMKTILLYIILLYIILLSTSCNQTNQNSESDSIQNDSLKVDNQNFSIPTTALPVEPLKILPASFVLDSIFSEDTTLNYSTTIYFPRSNDDELNKSIKQFVVLQTGLEKPESRTNDRTSLEMWVTNLKVSEHFIHCLFKKQSFTEGAAHSNQEYITFNYDPIKKKKISFTDIFKFSKSKSKESFCNKINGYVNGIDDSDGYNYGLKPLDIDNGLNYDIFDQLLTVYPNHCCAEEGKIFTCDLLLIQDYINSTIGKDYGLIMPETNPEKQQKKLTTKPLTAPE